MRELFQEFYGWVRPWRRYRRRLARRRHLPLPLARIAALDGWLTEPEARWLYESARAASGGCIVEIGTFHGKSTVALALGARDGGGAKVYGIDPSATFVGAHGRTFTPAEKIVLFQNLLVAGVVEHVWLLQTTSAHAASGFAEPVALLWVDGDHSYEGVQRDVRAWAPHVIPGGLLAFHDSITPRMDVGRFLTDLLASDAGYERVAVIDKITVLRKVDDGRPNGRG